MKITNILKKLKKSNINLNLLKPLIFLFFKESFNKNVFIY